MNKDSDKQDKTGHDDASQPAGDNRGAGDTDGNVAADNPRSKGAINPADQPTAAAKRTDQS
jgi:hypothetical protein